MTSREDPSRAEEPRAAASRPEEPRTETPPPATPRYEPPAEKAIREAMERGEFDNLPGAGKPLPDLGDPTDALWWVRGLAAREQLDFTGALPPAIALRKEAATFPESLLDLRSETNVREVLEDFNRRVKRDRLRLPEPGMPQLLAPTVDVDALVRQWRELKEQEARRLEAERAAAAEASHTSSEGGTGAARRRWWFWRHRRS